AGSIDSQTVKATRTSGQRGYDAGKKINGVKRHILVDTLGLLLAVVVHPANIQDRDGAKLVFAKAKLLGSWPRMERVWADGGSAGKLIRWVSSFCQWILEIVKSLSRRGRGRSRRVGATHRMPRLCVGGLHPPYGRRPGFRDRL